MRSFHTVKGHIKTPHPLLDHIFAVASRYHDGDSVTRHESFGDGLPLIQGTFGLCRDLERSECTAQLHRGQAIVIQRRRDEQHQTCFRRCGVMEG